MKIVRSRTGWLSALLAGAVLFTAAAEASAQQRTKMSSTLRYGSGHLDVPSASVIPHLAIMGTYSGFFMDTESRLITDGNGQIIGVADGVDDYFSDGSITLGLFDRVEIGTTLQSFGDSDEGGNMWGAFGRVSLLKPQEQGIGLAAGARYVAAPEFDDNVNYQPTRLGFPDRRFFEDLPDGGDPDDEVNTELTFYGVASAFLRGLDVAWLPEHDVTLSAGWGTGMFRDGEEIPFYSFADSEGFFGGATVHMQLAENILLNLISDYNGYDLNFGAQFDFGGFRVGGHWLGANYSQSDIDPFRSDKFGILGSVALCPQGDTFLCKPGLLARESADTVRLPAPAPDTVVVEREVEAPLPTGTPSELCLATGETAQVLVTAQGDTLVGADRVSIRTLRPGVVFAGTYAGGMAWFENDEAITFEERDYDKSGGPVRLECPNIRQIGTYMGVPLFADRSASSPYETIYVPVRPGVWQAYQTGLQRTRG